MLVNGKKIVRRELFARALPDVVVNGEVTGHVVLHLDGGGCVHALVVAERRTLTSDARRSFFVYLHRESGRFVALEAT